MSEPIQSISQGNYILQGTVATSAGIVGDGSTQNPLRADETVLYEGTNNTNPIILSEKITNFEKIEITWEHNYNNTIINHPIFTYFIPSNELFAYGGRSAGSGFVWFIAAWTVGSDNKTLTRTQSKYITITTSVGAPADNSNLFPIKVVGINRIGNS